MSSKNETATGLKITCPGIEDLNGEWKKTDVEEELRDLEMPRFEGDWIEWVLDHVTADFPEWTAELQEAFMSPTVFTMDAWFAGHPVRFEKTY